MLTVTAWGRVSLVVIFMILLIGIIAIFIIVIKIIVLIVLSNSIRNSRKNDNSNIVRSLIA